MTDGPPDDDPTASKVTRVAMCQEIMIATAEAFGFEGYIIASAGLFTSAGAFVAAGRDADDFAFVAREAHRLIREGVDRMTAASGDDLKAALLDKMDPQGGVS